MYKKYAGALLVAITLIVLFTGSALAFARSDDYILVAKDQVVDDDIYASGKELVIEGEVNGDVYALSERVSIKGQINGDLIAGASTVEVTGTVTDDVRVVGSKISFIGADIGDSISAAGEEIYVDSDSKVGGAMQVAGTNISVDGSINRGIVAGGETIKLNSDIGKDARIAATKLTLGDSALIAGNLEYNSPSEADVSEKAVIMGDTSRTNNSIDPQIENFMRNVWVGYNLIAWAGAMLVGLVFVKLFKQHLKKATQNTKEPVLSFFGWGAVALIGALPLIGILSVTVIGLPLAMIVFMVWMFSILMAKYYVGFAVGNWILDKLGGDINKINPYLAMSFGLTLYYGFRIVPGVGLFVRLTTTLAGLGILMFLMVSSQRAKNVQNPESISAKK